MIVVVDNIPFTALALVHGGNHSLRDITYIDHRTAARDDGRQVAVEEIKHQLTGGGGGGIGGDMKTANCSWRVTDSPGAVGCFGLSTQKVIH